MIDFGIQAQFPFLQDGVQYVGQMVHGGVRHISFKIHIYVKHSPRWTHKETADHWFGCPDDFVTFLFNPRFEHIQGDTT